MVGHPVTTPGRALGIPTPDVLTVCAVRYFCGVRHKGSDQVCFDLM
jgi:hypothetical protein